MKWLILFALIAFVYWCNGEEEENEEPAYMPYGNDDPFEDNDSSSRIGNWAPLGVNSPARLANSHAFQRAGPGNKVRGFSESISTNSVMKNGKVLENSITGHYTTVDDQGNVVTKTFGNHPH